MQVQQTVTTLRKRNVLSCIFNRDILVGFRNVPIMKFCGILHVKSVCIIRSTRSYFFYVFVYRITNRKTSLHYRNTNCNPCKSNKGLKHLCLNYSHLSFQYFEYNEYIPFGISLTLLKTLLFYIVLHVDLNMSSNCTDGQRHGNKTV